MWKSLLYNQKPCNIEKNAIISYWQSSSKKVFYIFCSWKFCRKKLFYGLSELEIMHKIILYILIVCWYIKVIIFIHIAWSYIQIML